MQSFSVTMVRFCEDPIGMCLYEFCRKRRKDRVSITFFVETKYSGKVQYKDVLCFSAPNCNNLSETSYKVLCDGSTNRPVL